jgi:hypothetical protein
MYAFIEISNQILEDGAFDKAGRWAWQVAPQDRNAGAVGGTGVIARLHPFERTSRNG